MTRSRTRKLIRTPIRAGVPLAAALAASFTPAMAQESSQGDGVLENIVVTAQKRQENLQDVPLSIQALGTETLEELRVSGFDDYVRFLPSVSYQTLGPGFAQVYMRGVASGGDGNHSGSLPSVGIYLDEQPITTIQGALDVHLYDIARVEALAGPQGTLYGASSQAGTLRIITNKPDPTKFSAGYDLEGNTVAHGGNGYLAEGFANVPLSDNMAIRLVGWSRHDAGYIDNARGTRTFPVSGITADNALRAKNDYNDVQTNGARAALKIDLNDSWSITPTVMAQEQKADGLFGFDPNVGDLKLTHNYPESSKDRWAQAALTVEGKIASLDVVYAGSYLKRDVDTRQDYADYSYWYDVCCQYGNYMTNDDGDLVDPSQFINGKDAYKRYTHELRFSTDSAKRVRFVGGLFMQRQEHGILQRYQVNDLTSDYEVTGWADTLWLTQQQRVDRDKAVFGELSFDLTEKLTATGGLRYFETENSLEGFFGFGAGFSSTNGESQCADAIPYRGAPCKNLDKTVEENDTIHKLNLSYKVTDDAMVYATWSRGFRPGGINRRGSLPPYLSDFLTSYEIGWKSTWAGNRLRFNGSLFSQEWEDFQFSILGANGLTEIKNANQARINGLEMDVTWAASAALTLSGGFALTDAELTENYCGFTDDNGNPVSDCADPLSPDGTQLPVTPKIKSNLTVRYEFPLASFDANLQASGVYVGKRWADLRLAERELLGELPSYATLDLSGGISTGAYSFELFVDNATDKRAELTRFSQCAEAVCLQPYVVTNMPRLIGLRFGQKF
jgi:outer membrane receptor protein involved in Fe transport